MTRSPRELLEAISRELAPGEDENRLVPLIARGQAPLAVLATLAGEQRWIITSDWRSFLALAARSSDPTTREFFAGLAQGESLALAKLAPFAAACGMDDTALAGYQPQAGCQAYAAYVAWLALNAAPIDVVVAMTANFAAWGGYCATVSQALRRHYGFDDQACGFFDVFATPAPEIPEPALAITQAGLEAGWQPEQARRHGRLLQRYELMFWNTLADQVS